MSTNSSIEWTEATWNPTRGCTRVSPGCQHCYAERLAYRFNGEGQSYEGLTRITNGHPQWTGEVTLAEDKLMEPLSWRKPRRIFVDSMSDLFHEAVPFSYIDKVFAVMALCPQHTFQILTKRAERMCEYVSQMDPDTIAKETRHFVKKKSRFDTEKVVCDIWFEGITYAALKTGPLPHVWLGVSVEDQQRADERIPWLLQTPAAVRFLSCEPLLSDLEIKHHFYDDWYCEECDEHVGGWRVTNDEKHDHCNRPVTCQQLIHWVIVGAESGPGARPMDEDWVRGLRDQCVAANTAFFYKQNASGGKKIPLPVLDGRQWAEYPG